MYVPIASRSSPGIAKLLADSIGLKCLRGPSTRRLCDARIKSQLLCIVDSIDMLRKPEEGETAISKICGLTSWEECGQHIFNQCRTYDSTSLMVIWPIGTRLKRSATSYPFA